MKAAAIYARVSTTGQVEGTSLDTQVDECKAFAQEHGYTVIKEIREDMSGATLRRPGLDTLRDMAANREIKALIVAEQDRLSRSLVDTMVLVQEFEDLPVALLFVREPRDDTAEGKMLFGMKGLFKEYERAKIAERIRRGKERRAKEGKILGTNKVPFGYTYVMGEGRFEECPGEAEWIPRMFEWYVTERCPLREVARRLDDAGVPRKQGGEHWRIGTVHFILKNSTYTGEWHWNKTEKHGTVRRSRDEWVAISVPALVSPDIYEAAQRRFQINKELCKRNCKGEWLLRGMLTCAQCGRRLVGVRGQQWKHYKRREDEYRCGGRYEPGTREVCRCHNQLAHKLEADVWEKLVEHLSNEDRINAALEDREQTRRTERQREDSELAANLAAEQKIKAEEDRHLDAYGKGVIDLERLQERMAITRKQREALQAARGELQERIKRREVATASREVVSRVSAVVKALKSPTYDEKRALLEAVEFRGVADGITGKLHMTWLLTDVALPDLALNTGEKPTTHDILPPTCKNISKVMKVRMRPLSVRAI